MYTNYVVWKRYFLQPLNVQNHLKNLTLAKNNYSLINKHLDSWRKGYKSSKKSTLSDIEIKDVYIPTEDNHSLASFETNIGFPGEFPFTRGVHKGMYRDRRWTMRQYAGFGTAQQTNERYHYLLAQGGDGLSVAFDLPTQMGRDSDHELARGEVGKVGVAIDSIEDMEVLFSGIALDSVSTSMTINATAHILLALYLELARKNQISWSALRGTIQNDILKEYIARGTYIYPPKPALKIVTDIFSFCKQEVPLWNTISISGYHIREAGSTAVQELAFTLADAIVYVESAIESGLSVDSFAPRLAFFFNCHNNFFEEVAKFRAARRLWASIMKERFNAKDPKSMMLRFHTQTAGSSLTAQQPKVNVVRTSLQALSAVLGGTQSLHTNAFDEALGLPTEEAAQLALRTQQVIALESGVADVVDPLAGSYFVESLTNEIEIKVRAYLDKIDSLGGMLTAIENGFPQREIEQSAFEYQRAIEQGNLEIVGLNACQLTTDQTSPVEVMKVDESLERAQIERLRQLKAQREKKSFDSSMRALDTACKEGQNIMPFVCEAVRAKATVGEISDVMRRCFGEYKG